MIRTPLAIVGAVIDRLFPPDPDPVVVIGCMSNEEVDRALD